MALLISNGLIMTPEGADVRVERGTLRIERDHISEVFYGEQAHQVLVGPADRVINAGRHLVIPGMAQLAPLEPFMWQAYFNLLEEGEPPAAPPQ